jgi:hypothetical protein
MGTCPVCKKTNIPLTEHHIFKRAVFGDNDIKFLICRECHDVLEERIRAAENSALRAFSYVNRKIFKKFIRGEDLSDEVIYQIVLEGFRKVINRITMSQNNWLEQRIKTKGVSINKKRR